jgi:hypothetical protein
MSPSTALRHRYLISDPARFACLCAALALWWAPEVPLPLTLLVAGSLQVGALTMAVRSTRPGWTWEGGDRLHSLIFASSLCADFAALAAGTATGALLLIRHFNGPEPVGGLALLAAGVCLLPDIRLCRLWVPRDPFEAAQRLRDGAFFRDPVLMGCLIAAGGILAIEIETLFYLLGSLILFHLGPLALFLDQYLPEIEVRRWRGALALALERDGRRLLLPVAALMLVPVRLAGGDRLAWVAAGLLGLAILMPDVWRLLRSSWERGADLLRVTPQRR